jgi:hypothetical protein
MRTLVKSMRTLVLRALEVAPRRDLLRRHRGLAFLFTSFPRRLFGGSAGFLGAGGGPGWRDSGFRLETELLGEFLPMATPFFFVLVFGHHLRSHSQGQSSMIRYSN